jgi:transitional endoplasmic reticulum ATPase
MQDQLSRKPAFLNQSPTSTANPQASPPNSDFDALMLEFKLVDPAQRMEHLQRFAAARLDPAERRQVLIAVSRYMLAQRGETSINAATLYESLLKLANSFELRVKLLEMSAAFIESLRREQISGELIPALERLLRALLPPPLPLRAKPGFSQELFLQALLRLRHPSNRHRVSDESVVNIAALGLFFFPFSWLMREVRADYNMSLGNYNASRSDFDRLIDQFPAEADYRLDRAEVLHRLEENDAALHDVEYFLEARPDDVPALRLRADLLMGTGSPMEALKSFSKLIELEPQQAEHLLSRAKAYEQLDFYDDAMKDLERAVELDPKLMEAQQFRHSLNMRRSGFGMEDDLYSAFSKGDEETFLGDTKVPDARFDDIGGLDNVKQLIRETIQYPMKYPELSAKYGKAAGGGLLFFGPPGCGKTMLARAAAGECGVHFINVNLATVLDKWVGNSEKAVSMIFALARKKAPAIIFLDEVDALGGSRATMQAGWEKKLISQLLIELDGLTSDNRNVMVLGASNAPWEVDFALRRPGRLGRLVFVPPPDVSSREDIFKIYLSRKPFREEEIDYRALAEATDKYSADAIRQVVENAAAIPWRKAIETGEERPIGTADALAALAEVPPDLAEWTKLVGRYEEFAKQSQNKSAIGFRKAGKPQANPT